MRLTGRELALILFSFANYALFFLAGVAYGFLDHRAGHHTTGGSGVAASCQYAPDFMLRSLCATPLDT